MHTCIYWTFTRADVQWELGIKSGLRRCMNTATAFDRPLGHRERIGSVVIILGQKHWVHASFAGSSYS